MRRLLPWLLPLLAAVAGLATVDVGPGPIIKYGVYFALGVALPGTLLLRAAWRSTGNWAEDLGLGSVVGATWQLIGWAIFTALGWQRWLIVWPALVLISFAIAGRQYCRIAEPKPLPVAWTWGLAVSAAVMVGATCVGVFAYHPMPPDGTAYYQDLLYHLSMVNELTRSVPPELPQVVGERLDYHWFANADMAGGGGHHPADTGRRAVPAVVAAVVGRVCSCARRWRGPSVARGGPAYSRRSRWRRLSCICSSTRV